MAVFELESFRRFSIFLILFLVSFGRVYSQSVQLVITARDNYELYVDDSRINLGVNSRNWMVPDTYTIQFNQLLAIKATRGQVGVPGILASVGTFITDQNWRCTSQLLNGWNRRAFDDRAWPRASVFGFNDQGNANYRFFVNGIQARSQWIWDASRSNEVYCRVVVPGITPPPSNPGLQLTVTCKERYTLYLNDQVQQGTNLAQWQRTDIYPVAVGTVIAIKGEGVNLGISGILASIGLANQQDYATTDLNWKCTNQLFQNWYFRQYDSRFWTAATDLGRNEARNNRFRFLFSSISVRAMWIWDSARSPVVYCRYTVPDQGGPVGPPTGGAKGPIGVVGPVGMKGEPGNPGPPGPQSGQGLTGPRGSSGFPGNPGNPGFPGNSGSPGNNGSPGSNGSPGPTGGKGFGGDTGRQGSNGSPGSNGRDAVRFSGSKGDTGEIGRVGAPGGSGRPGNNGGQGAPGVPGVPGVGISMGSTGIDGSPGNPGSPGFNGFPGSPGGLGNTGSTGRDGRPGGAGSPGAPGQMGTGGFVGGPGGPGGPGSLGANGIRGFNGSPGGPGRQGYAGGAGIVGATGRSGPSGFPGGPGGPGSLGQLGNTGAPGVGGPGGAGRPGGTGLSGLEGFPGSNGNPGALGNTGSPGGPGFNGGPGSVGTPGNPGSAGSPGVIGDTGFPGRNGNPGSSPGAAPNGSPGFPGAIGNTGQAGILGGPGGPGQQGSLGATGSAGQSGSPGGLGNTGFPGGPGSPGRSGNPGSAGQIGSPGGPGGLGRVGQQGGPGPSGQPGGPGGKGQFGDTGSNGFPGNPGPSGFPGLVGNTGPVGPNGGFGNVGSQGTLGSIGDTGFAGPLGSPGGPGNPGPNGVSGNPGRIGGPGSEGANGNPGFPGQQGATGIQGGPGGPGGPGSQGRAGSPGNTGPTGLVGFQGGVGRNGNLGNTGFAGPPGFPGGPGSPGGPGFNGGQGSTGQNGFPGNKGSVGDRGFPANSGGAGQKGMTGSPGFPGPSGFPGPNGGPGGPGGPGGVGNTGESGPSGFGGPDGSTGIVGPSGSLGPNGFPGSNGFPGPKGGIGLAGGPGFPGSVGPTGFVGSIGFPGLSGNPGSLGRKGDTGAAGQSFPGNAGPLGLPGFPGGQGPLGSPGFAGNFGSTGSQGQPGVVGPKGASGPKGFDGAGNPGNPGPPASSRGADGLVGISGPAGFDGPPGPPGPSGGISPATSVSETCPLQNECYGGKGTCHQKCVDTGESYYCTCKRGYKLKMPERPFSCPNSLDCSTAYTDLIFIVDSSFSLCPSTPNQACSLYAYLLEWVYAITLKLSQNTRLGMILTSNIITNYFSLRDFQSLAAAQNRIRAAQYSGGTGTALSAAIREARVNQFTPQNGDRTGVENVIVLLVNDISDMNQAIAEANLAKAAGITVIAVSITGKVSETQLLALISPPWGNSRSYHTGHLDMKNDPNLNPDRTTRLDPNDDYDVECVAARVCQASSKEDCSMMRKDVVIAIDTNPPSLQVWQELKATLIVLTEALNTNTNNWRFAFYTFAADTVAIRYLNADQGKASITNFINSLSGTPRSSPVATNWLKALQTIRASYFTGSNGGRSGVMNCVILMAFNPPNSNTISLLDETSGLHTAGIMLYSYGWDTRISNRYILKFVSSHPHVQDQNWAYIDSVKLPSLPSIITNDLCRPSLQYKCKKTEFGGYQCFCPISKCDIVPTNGTQCIDVDECANLNGGCQHICSNSLGTYACSCKTGFKLSNNTKKCQDINECLLPNVCITGLCVNSYGSYYCLVRSALNVQGLISGGLNSNDPQWDNGFPWVAVLIPVCLLILLLAIVGAALVYKAKKHNEKDREGETSAPAKASVDMFTWRSKNSKNMGITDFNHFSNGNMGIGSWGVKKDAVLEGIDNMSVKQD